MQESIWEGEWDMTMTGMLPHFTSLQEALSALFGNGIQAVRHDRVSGGDINEAYSLAWERMRAGAVFRSF